MTLQEVEAIIWSQVRNLGSDDQLRRDTAMDAVLAAVTAHAEHQAGPIIRARRGALEDVR